MQIKNRIGWKEWKVQKWKNNTIFFFDQQSQFSSIIFTNDSPTLDSAKSFHFCAYNILAAVIRYKSIVPWLFLNC